MSAIFIEQHDSLKPLIIEVEKELSINGYATYTSNLSKSYHFTRKEFDTLLTSDILLIFLSLDVLHDDEYIDRVRNLTESSKIGKQEIKTVAVIFPEPLKEIKDAELKFMNDFDYDYRIVLGEFWENQPYVEAFKIVQRIQEYLSPENARIQEKKEIKHNIEQNAPEFINTAITALELRGKKLGFTANLCFILGSISIITCIIYVCMSFSQTMDYLTFWNDWKITSYILIKGLVLIGLFITLAKYTFILGKAYMHESLKIKERMHAIAFGQFYLNVYKETVNPSELKDVFRDWNISNQASAFSYNNSESDFNPKHIEGILKIIDKSKEVTKSLAESVKTES